MKHKHSRDPVAENAQHEPQSPWFLIGVTAPAVTQLTEAGRLVVFKYSTFFESSVL